MSKQSVDDLKDKLLIFSEVVQKLIQESSVDEDTKELCDQLMQQCHYMYSYIIDALS